MRCMGKASMALQIKLDSLYMEHLVRQPPENEHWFSSFDPRVFTTFTSAGLCLWLLLGGGGGSPFLALISLFKSFRERDGTRCLATPISSPHSFVKGSAMKHTIEHLDIGRLLFWLSGRFRHWHRNHQGESLFRRCFLNLSKFFWLSTTVKRQYPESLKKNY